MRILLFTLGMGFAMAAISATAAEEPAANYDESKIPPYTLPDPLRLADGQRVTDAATWRNVRRGEVLRLFQTYVYGKAPGRPSYVRDELRSQDDALGGPAVRKQVTIHLTKDPAGPRINVLLYLPKAAKGPVPVFVGLNFDGNQYGACRPRHRPGRGLARQQRGDGDLRSSGPRQPAGKTARASGPWKRSSPAATAWRRLTTATSSPTGRKAVPAACGVGSSRWTRHRAADDGGAIAAWGWGLSRILDYLETDHAVDARHVAVFGHSRLGKSSLWAGACDERFAMVIGNDAGCGGALLARRGIGETVARITHSFPHWFCENYKGFGSHVRDLPVDQHMLMALIAPRPLYIASAEDDHWGDPHGEFLSPKNADPVYRLLGTDGLATEQMPAVEHPVMSTIAYHIRRGPHGVTDYDWQQYLNFADLRFKGKSPEGANR